LFTSIRTTETLVVISSADFREGYEKGRIWYFHGEAEGEPDDAYVVGNIASLIARRCSGDDLYWHVGFLLGMVSGKFIPEH
jgi:hypothetical protein